MKPTKIIPKKQNVKAYYPTPCNTMTFDFFEEKKNFGQNQETVKIQ